MPTTEAEPRQPRPRRLLLIVALVVPVLLIGAGVVAYASGAFESDSRHFAEAPPMCETITPSVGLLGKPYKLVPTASGRGCDLLIDGAETPKITVAANVLDDADTAGEMLRRTGPAAEPLEDLGDEAYGAGHNIYLRIGNLVLAVLVYPNEASTEYQVKTFTADVAKRLAT